MFCLEMVIVEVLILIMMSIELWKIRKYILSKKYYKVDEKTMGKAE